MPLLEVLQRFVRERSGWVRAASVALAGLAVGIAAANRIERALWETMPAAPRPRVEAKAPQAVAKPPLSTYAAILERNLFAIDVDRSVPVEPAPAVDTATTVAPVKPSKSPLPAEVVGMLAGPDEVAVALIRDKRNQEVGVYFVGDNLLNQATILKINRGEVIVLRGGQQEVLQLFEAETADEVVERLNEESPRERGKNEVNTETETEAAPAVASEPGELAVEEVDEGRFVIDKESFNAVMQNLGPILTQARVVPNFKDGKIQGYKIFAIKEGSVFEAIGLQNGDIIQSINGVGVDTPEKALQLFQQLRSESDFALLIERGGTSQEFQYALR